MKPPLHFPLRIPFVEELGFELWRFDGGHAELRVDLREGHLNSWEVAHGGVLMSLLDVAMAMAARSAVVQSAPARSAVVQSAPARSAVVPGAPPSIHRYSPDGGPGVATIEMKTSFMRPAEGQLRAEGHVLEKTSTLAFTEGRVFDATGRLCAHATGTFKYLRRLPTGSRRTTKLQSAAEPDQQEPE